MAYKPAKFKIGDKVRLKKDIEPGEMYYHEGTSIGDKLTFKMFEIMDGQEATIVDIREGYVLDKDRIHTYYDEMIEHAKDDLAEEPYKFNLDVELLIKSQEADYYKKQIDKALDEKLHETDPQEFQKLVNLYKAAIR
jgi:hypothetical protein